MENAQIILIFSLSYNISFNKRYFFVLIICSHTAVAGKKNPMIVSILLIRDPALFHPSHRFYFPVPRLAKWLNFAGEQFDGLRSLK